MEHFQAIAALAPKTPMHSLLLHFFIDRGPGGSLSVHSCSGSQHAHALSTITFVHSQGTLVERSQTVAAVAPKPSMHCNHICLLHRGYGGSLSGDSCRFSQHTHALTIKSACCTEDLVGHCQAIAAVAPNTPMH